MEELACESCHTPQLYAPAVQSYDWTVLRIDGQPVSSCRGVEGTMISDLVTGFTPVLLSRQNIDGQSLLAPYNLISAWYWVYDEPQGPRPVRLEDLQSAYFTAEAYAAEVLAALDANADGSLSDAELLLDTPEKQAVIAGRLAALGLANPRIEGEVQPYSINHNVARGDAAIKDCAVCHADSSRLTQPMILADRLPGGVLPAFVSDANTPTGELSGRGGRLSYARRHRPGLVRLQSQPSGLVDGSGFVLPACWSALRAAGLRFASAPAPRPCRARAIYAPCTSGSGTGCRRSPSSS
jgi:hypothetical protein